MARKVTTATARKVIAVLADKTGIPADAFGLDTTGEYPRIWCEGHYPDRTRFPHADYWTDTTMYDAVTGPIHALGVYVEPIGVADAGIYPI